MTLINTGYCNHTVCKYIVSFRLVSRYGLIQSKTLHLGYQDVITHGKRKCMFSCGAGRISSNQVESLFIEINKEITKLQN